MHTIEVSIIVPVYNAEKYLDKCIKSILNQKFTGFELILINDGSSDKSLEIINNYKLLDDRIKVINQQNSGSSHSRNAGIHIAKGKYICFVDSDDWIEDNMLIDCISIMKTNETDMVISGMYIDKVSDEGKIYTQINNYKYCKWDTVDKIKCNIIDIFPNALINSSCNKLYRKDVIKLNKIEFLDTNIGEDTIFNLEILKYVKSIIITDKSYYHYMRYPSNLSLTRQIINDAYERYLDIHKKMNDLFLYWGEIDKNIYYKINQTMFSQYFSTTLKILKADKNIYPYDVQKKMLDNGLKNNTIIETFNHAKYFSYKEKLFRMMIKNRYYFLARILLKIKS